MIWINAIGVVIYALTTWYILWKHKKYLVIFLKFVFAFFWGLISCYYNDLGVYNLELFRYTHTSLATFGLAMFGTVFNLGFLAMAALVGERPLARQDYRFSKATFQLGNLKMSAYIVVALLLAYVIHMFATEGIPLMSGLGRHVFMDQANPMEKLFLVYGSLVAFVLGYFRLKRGRYSVNGVLMMLFVVFGIFIGNKFSFLTHILTYYYVSIYVRYHASHPGLRLFNRGKITAYAGVLVVILGLVFASYTWTKGDSRTALTYMYNRVLAFQGQLWWAVDNDVQENGRYDRDHWKAELDAIVDPGNSENGEVGLKYIMVKVLGAEKAYPIIDNGYLYTAAYPAILIATFPYAIALVIQFVAGMFLLLMLYYLYYTILYRHTIRAFIMVLVVMPYTVAVGTGNLAVFLTFGMVVKIGVLILLELGLVRTGIVADENEDSQLVTDD